MHPFLQNCFKLSACQQQEVVSNSSLKGRQDANTDKLEAHANQRSETEKAYEIIQPLSRGALQNSFVIFPVFCVLVLHTSQ